MTAVSESGAHTSLNGDTLQVLANWLKSSGVVKPQEEDPLMEMIQRYPAGLLSKAEMEALVTFFIR